MTHDRRLDSVILAAGLLLIAAGCSGGDGGTASADADIGPAAKLFINELQPSNQDTVTDEYGEADDWIEIVNAGDVPVDLLGFTLADSSGTTQTIPSAVVLAAGAFHLLWADDSPSQGPSHLGFKLGGKAGDSVTLKDNSGRKLDSVSFGPTTGQNTYARFPDATGPFAWCGAPTPGAANGAACLSP
jgi:hypothetical protein